jgi:hypothetical protein
LNTLPLFTSGRARLLDHNTRLVGQFAALERRTSATGRDRVDHPASGGGADDVANAAAGALTLASAKADSGVVIAGPIIVTADSPYPGGHAEWRRTQGNNPFPQPGRTDFTNRQ